MEGLFGRILEIAAWLGLQATWQDLAKAALLTAFVLVILVVLGDVYRGEIQNTFHRIRVIAHRSRVPGEGGREALKLPKYMVQPTLDGVYSNALFYYRYRDHLGRIRTKPLRTYRVQLHVRRAYSDASAPGLEGHHRYTDDELSALEKEKPSTSDRGLVSEIVSLSGSRADYLNETMQGKVDAAHSAYSKLSRSKIRRWLMRVRETDLREPEMLGLVMKFHFPINPYFLLYRHPDTNIRSTAWLTVLTSVFALFMQIVYGPGPDAPTRARPLQTVEVARIIPTAH